MAVTYTVKNYIDAEKLQKDMSYSTVNLTEAMMQQGSLMVHYGMQAAYAAKQVDDVALILDVTESKIYRMLRDEAEGAGEKLTETQLMRSVNADANVINIRRALSEAKQVKAIAQAAVQGFRNRKDMLVQEGSQQREEMKGEVSIRRREAAADERQATGSRVAARLAAQSGE